MKCPGQDRRYWVGPPTSEVPCPSCGVPVEVFRDESTARCTHCGHRFPNPGSDFGCAQWCSLAKECLGFAPTGRSVESSGEGALAARLIQAIQRHCSDQPARMGRALRAFQYARELVEQEGGDPRAVLAAALIFDWKSRSGSAAEVQESLAPLNLEPDVLAQVVPLLAERPSGEKHGNEDRDLVEDAYQLALLSEQVQECAGDDPGASQAEIAARFKTETGRKKAALLVVGVRSRDERAR